MLPSDAVTSTVTKLMNGEVTCLLQSVHHSHGRCFSCASARSIGSFAICGDLRPERLGTFFTCEIFYSSLQFPIARGESTPAGGRTRIWLCVCIAMSSAVACGWRTVAERRAVREFGGWRFDFALTRFTQMRDETPETSERQWTHMGRGHKAK